MLIKINWEDSKEEVALKVYSHNIRYANPHPTGGEELWEKRKHLVASSISFSTFNQTAVVCLQEVLHSQLLDLLDILGSDWTYCGVGRDDGGSKGEYCPILFRKSQFKVEMTTTFWLSDTPDIPSKGWDAASPRILNVALLSHKPSGRAIYALNTHLDDQGAKARLKGANVIKAVIGNLQDHDALVLCGDLNSKPDQEAYPVLTSILNDTKAIVDPHQVYGNSDTFTGFTEKDEKKVIDYIFVHKGVTIANYAVLVNKFDDGVYSSDHRPVVANLILPDKNKT